MRQHGGQSVLDQRGRTESPPRSVQPACLGFSLVELVIAMAILSVGIVGAMRVFPVGLRASQHAEMSSRAAFAAQRTIESLKLTPWDELKDGQASVQDQGFQITTRIAPEQPVGLADPTRLKTIQVTVQWTQDGRSRNLTFVTYIRHEPS